MMYLRLDRALATSEWIDYYKEVRVHHLVHFTSDHYALLIIDTIAHTTSKKTDSILKPCGQKKRRNVETLLKQLRVNVWI